MRYYLSSFKIGNEIELFTKLYRKEKPIGYISNALDHIIDQEWLNKWTRNDIGDLTNLGFQVQPFDLREYFYDEKRLQNALQELAGLWICGGNVFVLRQAMKLSGLDKIVLSEELPKNFVYGGYSAGCCVLSPTLRAYSQVDKPDVKPYPEAPDTIWEGLGVLDFCYMPHYKSDHSETEEVDKEIDYCREQNIPFKTFRDGEVLFINVDETQFYRPKTTRPPER